MPEWEDSKYRELLTSTIWNSGIEAIKEKLKMSIWEDPRYIHLLVPSIFSISKKNIINGIELLDSYGISEFVTNRCLRKRTSDLKELIEYLISKEVDLVVVDVNGNKKLNPILSASKIELKEKYGIDMSKMRLKK